MSDEVSTIPEKRFVPHKESKKRSKAEIERDKIDIARLYLEQKTQLQIVEWIKLNRPYNLSTGMVCFTLKQIFEDWKLQAVSKIDELKARDLAKLLDIERTASEAWERSLARSEKTTHEHDEVNGKIKAKSKKGKKKSSPTLRVSVVKENRDGDPRFLEVILKCIAQRAEILGYRPNRKIEEGGEDAPIVVSVEVQTALEIAYGNNNKPGNSGSVRAVTNVSQSGARAMVTVRDAGGGDWSPERPVVELREGATNPESEAT